MSTKTTPYTEDQAVTETAERLGFEVIRQRVVTITDLKAIKEAGLVRETPDYKRIKALLSDGAEVKGAAWGPMEYVLRVPSVKEEELDI